MKNKKKQIFKKRKLIVIILILVIFIAGLITTFYYKKNNYKISNLSQNSSIYEDILPNANFSDYIDTEKNSDFLPLTRENMGQYVNAKTDKYEITGFVPYVISEGDSYLEVYGDNSNTTIKLPKGWYGVGLSGKASRYFNSDLSAFIYIAFTSFDEKILSTDQLLSKFEGIKQELFEQFTPDDFEMEIIKIDEETVIVLLKGKDLSKMSSFRLNHQKPEFVHMTELTVPYGEFDHYSGLFRLILESEEIIGMKKGEDPYAREKFLQEHDLLPEDVITIN